MSRMRAIGLLIATATAALYFGSGCNEDAEGGPAGNAGADAAGEDGDIDAGGVDGGGGAAWLDGAADVVDDGAGTPDEGTVPLSCSPFGGSRLSPSSDHQPFVVVADFDCDSRPDAVRAQSYHVIGDKLSGRIDFFPGMGNGSFNPPIPLQPGGLPLHGVAGDFNGDGVADLVVAVADQAGSYGRLLLYRGECREGLTPPLVLLDPNPYLATDMTVADMNGDGRDDLLVSIAATPARVDVLFGGGEAFQSISESDPFSGWVRYLTPADLDGDGDTDVVAVSDDRWDVFANDGAGLLTHVSFVTREASSAPAMIDLNADGIDELVTLRADGFVEALHYEPETGGFASVQLFEAPEDSRLVVGDIDGNGRKDLALSAGDHTELFFPDKGLGERLVVPFTEGTLALADVTGDGRTDLVYGTSHALEVFPNQPATCERRLARCEAGDAFGEVTLPLGFVPTRLLFGDLNGDHTTDVVAVSNSTIGVLHTNAKGMLVRTRQVEVASRQVVVGDLDGDGVEEIVAIDGSPGWLELRGGDLRRVKPDGFPAANDLVVGDFDCDRRADLAFEQTGGAVDVLILRGGDPTARFEWGDESPYGTRLLRAADFDLDGCTDLLMQPQVAWTPCIVRGPIRTDSRCEGSVAIQSPVLDFVDLNGDGTQELLVSHDAATVAVWDLGASARHDLVAPDHGWFTARFVRSDRRPPALLLAAKGGALEVHETDGAGELVMGGPQAVQQLDRDLTIAETADLDRDGIDEVLTVATGQRSMLSLLRSCR